MIIYLFDGSTLECNEITIDGGIICGAREQENNRFGWADVGWANVHDCETGKLSGLEWRRFVIG